MLRRRRSRSSRDPEQLLEQIEDPAAVAVGQFAEVGVISGDRAAQLGAQAALAVAQQIMPRPLMPPVVRPAGRSHQRHRAERLQWWS
jgi:hypothetical protein